MWKENEKKKKNPLEDNTEEYFYELRTGNNFLKYAQSNTHGHNIQIIKR